jgi:3-oxoacyl-[acyl-carrier protein] reductase
MDLHLRDKVALVTGGSHGLGKAVCLALAGEGAKVAVHYYRDAQKGIDLLGEAEDVVREISDRHGVETLAVPGDLAREADIVEIFRRTVDTFGRVDVLVNNAGVWPTDYVKDMSLESWDSTLRVNLTGVFLTCREMVTHLLSAGRGGRIVNISSQAAFHGATSGHADYAAAKCGLHAFTVSLAREVATDGIAVNVVAPGMMFTEMTRGPLEDEERKRRYVSRIPLGRVADPAEIARVVVFLASEKASYITGAALNVSGGMVMR